MFTQCLVFLSGPFDQLLIQLANHRVKRRAVVPPVVLEPAPDNRIVEARQIFQGLVAALQLCRSKLIQLWEESIKRLNVSGPKPY